MEWFRLEKEILAQPNKWTTRLPPCPRLLNNCTGPLWREPGRANPEHTGGVTEVRSVGINGFSNQCIYDANGVIMTRMPAAGTADFRECDGLKCWGHTFHDLDTWWLAKGLDIDNGGTK